LTSLRSAMFPRGVSQSRLAKQILFIVALVIIICPISLFSAVKLNDEIVDIHAPTGFALSADISFIVEFISVDPLSRTLTTDWYPYLATQVNCDAQAINNPFVADINFDSSYLDPSSASFNGQPAYSINSSSLCNPVYNLSPYFRVVSKLLDSRGVPDPRSTRLSSQIYPFDSYYVQFLVSASNSASGNLLPINVTNSFGTVENFEVELVEDTTFGISEPQLLISLRLERSLGLRMFVILITAAKWILAITFLITSITSLFKLYQDVFPPILLIPVGILLIFSTMISYPGAPIGFGSTIGSSVSVLFILVLSIVLIIASLILKLTQINCDGNKAQSKGESRA